MPRSGQEFSFGGIEVSEVVSAVDSVTHIKQLSSNRMYALDSFLYEGQPKQWLSIGKDAHCDIQLDDDLVEDCHCLLRRKRDQLFVHDEKAQGRTLINGVPFVGEFGEVLPGNLITIGATTFLACGQAGAEQPIRMDSVEQTRRLAELHQADHPEPESAPEAGDRTTRTCTRDTLSDSELDPVRSLWQFPSGPLHELFGHLDPSTPDRPVSIGAIGCDITITLDEVSTRHCSIEHRDGRWHVRDDGSHNGTFLNGVPLASGQAELVAGSLLTLGTRVTFLVCGRRGAEQPVTFLGPTAAEQGRRAVRIVGSENKAARMLSVARSTLQGWLGKNKAGAS